MFTELTLDHCIKCNICTSFCPVAAVTDLFPGPKYAGPQSGRFRSFTGAQDKVSPVVDRSVDYCSGCGLCTLVCPNGVKIAEMNARARGAMWARRGIPLRNRLLGRSELLGKLGSPFAPLANAALHNPWLRRATEVVLGIDHQAPLPPFAWATFRGWFRAVHQPGLSTLAQNRHRDRTTAGVAPAQGQRATARVTPTQGQRAIAGVAPAQRQVVYFHGCSTNYYEPRVGRAAVALLERNGFEVIVPDQNCCGLPLISNGEFDTARRYAASNLRKLAPYAHQGIPIVATSTSCSLTLKSDYRVILGLDSKETHLVAEDTYDICEFLMGLYGQGQLDTHFHELPLSVPYHAPCQLQAHGIGRPALDLLEMIPGLHVVEMDADCCGIAGTYGYKAEKYEIAMAVGERLFAGIRETQADLVACDSETCRWQIEHGTGLRAVHPIELLQRAYRQA